MKKVELVEAVATKTGLTKADATRAIEATFEVISGALAKGDKENINELGIYPYKEIEILCAFLAQCINKKRIGKCNDCYVQ